MQSFKSLLVTLLIVGGAFLAYDYYLAPDADKIVFKRPGADIPPKDSNVPVPTVATEPSKAPETVTPPPVMPLITPPTPANPPPPPAPTPPDSSKVGDGFVPPVFPSVEHATANWTRIPMSAFPRQAKVSKAIKFKSSFGAMEVTAGSEVTVMGAANKMLTVAPNAKSALRATVELEATDLQATLTQAYESWRSKRIEAARYAWAHRNDAPVVAPAKTRATAADGRPEQASDGTYPLLLASMKSGQVTEVTPSNITKWNPPVPGEHEGKKSWDVVVDFDAQTAFGPISASAIAKVVEGRVAGWFYQGSGETVP